MNVAWRLALVFIAIVTYTPRLTWSGEIMFWVRDLKLKLNQSDVSKVTHVWHKKSHSPISLAKKLKVTKKYRKKYKNIV